MTLSGKDGRIWIPAGEVIPLVKNSHRLHWKRKRWHLRILVWAKMQGAQVHRSYLNSL
jgi:hypothetical protein